MSPSYLRKCCVTLSDLTVRGPDGGGERCVYICVYDGGRCVSIPVCMAGVGVCL